MTEQNDYETSLRECWRRECGATAEERPNPSPSFRNIFKAGYEAGRQDKSGGAEQLRVQIAKELFVGGLNHSDGAARGWCFRNLPQHIEECISAADFFVAELNKTER